MATYTELNSDHVGLYTGVTISADSDISSIAAEIVEHEHQLQFTSTKKELLSFFKGSDTNFGEVGKFSLNRLTWQRYFELANPLVRKDAYRRFTYGTTIIANILLKSFTREQVHQLFTKLGPRHKQFSKFIKKCPLTENNVIHSVSAEIHCDKDGLNVSEIIALNQHSKNLLT